MGEIDYVYYAEPVTIFVRRRFEWDEYFTHGEELVLFRHDFYSYGQNAERWTSVYAIVVHEDKLEETVKDITAFIWNECENALRADGQPLYANVNGSIYLLFQKEEGAE